MKEKFKQKDIERLDKLWVSYRNRPTLEDWESKVIVNISANSTKMFVDNKIEIPAKLFYYLLRNNRYHVMKYLPVNFLFVKLDETEDYWLKDTDWTGITESDKKLITIRLKDKEHSILSLLFIMFHEFRHWIQMQNSNVETCNWNKGYEKYLEFMMELTGKDQNVLQHVLHEVLPYEVDANIFACELLEVDYPMSKFAITKKILEMLK